MTRPAAGAFLLAALLTACSSLAGDADTPIAIEIRAPLGVGGGAPLVEIGDTLQLQARALNQAGDSIAASFTWRTPDTALLYVEAATGRITGRQPGIARIQVTADGLVSDLVSFSVVPAADTLVQVSADTVRIPVTDTASTALVAELDTINPTGPLQGRQITYQLTTIFGQPGDTASLAGGVMTRVVSTSGLGQPTVPVYVREIPGQPRPDSVFVVISAFRPSGAAIPGSGQTFIVRFD